MEQSDQTDQSKLGSRLKITAWYLTGMIEFVSFSVAVGTGIHASRKTSPLPTGNPGMSLDRQPANLF